MFVMSNKKKLPEDYPSFIFRISKADKIFLTSEIKRALLAVRKTQTQGEKLHNKNDVIVEALKIGLSQIKKRKILES